MLDRTVRQLLGSVFVAVVWFHSGMAWTVESIGEIEATSDAIVQQVDVMRDQYLAAQGFRGAHHAEERLIDGENFYRLKDYQRAAIIFLDIIETYEDHPAYPDALFYYADSLFLSRDFYGARSWFETFLEHGNKPGFARFRPKVVARLVEVSIHLEDYDGVAEHFDSLGNSPGAESYYVKGKFLYFQGDYSQARNAFSMVSGNVGLELKSAYFIGVTHVKEGQYDQAIEVFRNAVGKYLEVSPQEQELVDLLNLAIGRVYFEKDFVENAAAAYQKVGRYSPYYDVALYEAASVQMRAGNTIMAERILEVLTLAMPDSRYIPKARLLRGHLLLQAGRYEEAERVFVQTIDDFEPLQQRLSDAIRETDDGEGFFDRLIRRSMDSLDTAEMIPSEVIKWVGEEEQVQRAFDLTADLGQAHEYTVESERLLRMISSVVDGGNPVNAIPTLRSAKGRCLVYRNQVARLYMALMQHAERLFKDNSALVGLARQRSELATTVRSLPVTDSQFRKREKQAKEVFVRMRKELSRQEIVLDQLVATIVALERYIQKPDYAEEVDADVLDVYKDDLGRQRQGVDVRRNALRDLKEDIDKAIYQIGVGDERDLQDQATIRDMVELAGAYSEFLKTSGAGNARQLLNGYASVDRARKAVVQLSDAIDLKATQEVSRMRQQLALERERIGRYKVQLSAINDEATDVVNGVARENFSSIRQRFHDLLLKADVGIIDIAWMRKEEHKSRGIRLNKERVQEIQGLDSEFGDVDEPAAPGLN